MQFQLLRERKAVINCDATYVREQIIISWRRERLRNHSDGDWQYPPGTCDIAREKSGVSPLSFPDDKCVLNETHNGTQSRRQERGNAFCRLTSYEAVSWLSQIECFSRWPRRWNNRIPTVPPYQRTSFPHTYCTQLPVTHFSFQRDRPPWCCATKPMKIYRQRVAPLPERELSARRFVIR